MSQDIALKLSAMYDYGDPLAHGNRWKVSVCTELRRQHARIEELEAALVSITQYCESVAVDAAVMRGIARNALNGEESS